MIELARTALLTFAAVLLPAASLAGQSAVDWTVAPEPTVEVGVVEGDSAYVFGSVRSARLLPDGRIVVVDAQESSIRIYGPAGELRTRMGRAGGGPGEFRSVAEMWTVPPDTIQVLDFARPGVTTYLADGTLVGTTGVDATPPGGGRGLLDVAAGRFDDGDLALGWTVGRVSRSDRFRADRIVLGRFGPDGGFEHRLGEGEGLVRFRGSPVVFSPYPHFAVLRDSVYYADGDGAEVAVFGPDGGGIVRTLRLPDASTAGGEAWSTLEAALRDRGESARLRRLRSRGRRERTPALGGLLGDERGFLWVKPYDPSTDCVYVDGPPPGAGGTWWVVTPGGRRVGDVAVPDDVVPLDIRGNRLLGLTRDQLDVERIVVHEIRR